MTWDDYRAQVADDVANALEEEWDRGWMDGVDLDAKTIDPSALADDLWADDNVTGNGSGSYTFSRAEAARNVAEAIWSDEFAEILDEWDLDAGKLFGDGPEAVDVTIRCYLLGEVCQDVAERFAEAHGFEVV